ncbi:MAG TPA: PAS domain-containing sensor histidine kinase [Bacteroidia bacterium]|mgnify:CR=1 FL=1|nr:PAS domain-containing sensor histidine kinase [Bacteroidia bacterium]
MRIVFKQPSNFNHTPMPSKIRSTTFKTTDKHEFPVEDFFNHVIDSLQVYSIFTLDTNLLINSWNSGATQIFQYEPHEILKSHFEVIFTEEDKKNGVPSSEISIAVQSGKALDNRWHIRKDGSKFYAQGQVFPVKSSGGELVGFVKILRDLTENKRTEEAISKYISDLEELNAHKDNILAILSHDLRSPLARMISITQYLMSDFESINPTEFKNLLKHLNKSVIEELNMLDYLLEWARIKYASQVFTPAYADIYQYVMKAFETVQASATTNHVKLENHLQENTMVYADGKMLLSVIQNILTNAIKHSKEGDKVTVSLYKKDEDVVVMIKDTGIGIAPEVLQNLFIPNLESLANSRKKDKGAGIGLLLTKSFLETNGGKIWVESTVGQGASFYFSLPARKSKEGGENRLDFSGFMASV